MSAETEIVTTKKCSAKRCSAESYARAFGLSQCSRKGIIERDGKLFCKQHDPVSSKIKKDERDAAWRAQWVANTAKQMRDGVILTMCKDMTADEVRQALEAWKSKAEAGA